MGVKIYGTHNIFFHLYIIDLLYVTFFVILSI